jgi:hypothetical protein
MVDIESVIFARAWEETPTGKAMLVCLLRCPDNTGGGTGGIETGVGLVAFVCLAEVAVDAGAELYKI